MQAGSNFLELFFFSQHFYFSIKISNVKTFFVVLIE